MWERGQAGEARVPGRMGFVVLSASVVLNLGSTLESTGGTAVLSPNWNLVMGFSLDSYSQTSEAAICLVPAAFGVFPLSLCCG